MLCYVINYKHDYDYIKYIIDFIKVDNIFYKKLFLY